MKNFLIHLVVFLFFGFGTIYKPLEDLESQGLTFKIFFQELFKNPILLIFPFLMVFLFIVIQKIGERTNKNIFQIRLEASWLGVLTGLFITFVLINIYWVAFFIYLN